ncbi:MAG: endolytic transglycosylase MltG [Acidobacteriota bacterium]
MRLLKRFLVLTLILLLVGGVVGYWSYSNLNTPHTHTATTDLIVIEPGMSKKAIINRLALDGIISNRLPVLIYLLLRPQAGKLQAGEYRFESPITPLEVLNKLQRGLVATEQITIPEGYDHFDVVQVLTAAKIDTPEAIELAIRDTSLIADLDPEARDLEGYLFPDTYSFTRQTRALPLITAMVRRCRQVLTPERVKRAQERGLNVRQLLVLASMVEREAKVDEERAVIAAVFYNRLKRNMKLDCDPTFIYAAKLTGAWDNNVNNPAHRRRESPYNTYFTTGLPPGPIASPGVESIDAALYPAEVDYLYFVVSGTDGHHKFSRTEAEHLAAVAAYQRQQRQAQRN